MTAALMSSGLIAEIAGHEIPVLAQEFGTPVYVYDAAKVAERIADLAAFDVVRYAQKACSNLAILDLNRSARSRVRYPGLRVRRSKGCRAHRRPGSFRRRPLRPKSVLKSSHSRFGSSSWHIDRLRERSE